MIIMTKNRYKDYKDYQYEPDDCYFDIGSSSIIKSWFDDNFDQLNFDLDVFHFEGCLCPEHIWLQEPILASIHNRYPIRRAGFLKISSFRCYDWHTDVSRGLAVNCVMSPTAKSVCLFGSSLNKAQLKFVELDYRENTFYLFNTQIPHMVINWETDRYLFSVEFEQDQESLTYQTVKNWLTSNFT